MKPIVSFDEFNKIDLRIGMVVACEEKEGSDKLLRLTVDFGIDGKRTILSGIKQWYKPETLIGKSFLFVLNLEPRKIMGDESAGMILAANAKKPVPLKPISKVPPGTALR